MRSVACAGASKGTVALCKCRTQETLAAEMRASQGLRTVLVDFALLGERPFVLVAEVRAAGKS